MFQKFFFRVRAKLEHTWTNYIFYLRYHDKEKDNLKKQRNFALINWVTQ